MEELAVEDVLSGEELEFFNSLITPPQDLRPSAVYDNQTEIPPDAQNNTNSNDTIDLFDILDEEDEEYEENEWEVEEYEEDEEDREDEEESDRYQVESEINSSNFVCGTPSEIETPKVFPEGKVYMPSDILKIAIDVYGEDKVDFKIHSNKTFAIDIWFPEIEITNTKNHKHIIRDLVVRFIIGISHDEKCLYTTIKGFRNTFTAKERYSSYVHSHLPQDFNGFRRFCVGSGDFPVVMAKARIEMNEMNWYLLFHSINTFVRWESLAGGPYIRMEDITQTNSNTVNTNILYDELKKFIWKIPEHLFQVDKTMELINSREFYDIVNNSSTIRDIMNNPIDEKTIADWEYGLNGNCMTWKGKQVKRKILRDTAEENPQVSKDLVARYAKIITTSAEDFSIKETIKRLKQYNND